VVDRSGSIAARKLVLPIRGAIVETIGKMQQNAEVRIVLFNQEADRRERWQGLDTVTKGSISVWFEKNFEPSGNTRLFDTLGEVLEEISRDKDAFDSVELTVLSDGAEEPPVSTRFRSWKDLQPFCAILTAPPSKFVGTWYTLGFQPSDVPGTGSCIRLRAVPDPWKTIFLAPPPLADFDLQPARVPAGEPVLFTPRSDTGGQEFRWTFGDGDSSAAKQPRHAYREPGAYDVTLEVEGPGGKDSRTRKGAVQVVPAQPLSARFEVSVLSGTAPMTVRFADKSAGAASYSWDFGDGESSTLRNPEHVYGQSGTFRPRLTITSPYGMKATDPGDTAIRVRAPMPPPLLAGLLALAGLLTWCLVIVPILRHFMEPGPSASASAPLARLRKGYQTIVLRDLVRRGWSRWFWPRRAVTIGSGPDHHVRTGAGGQEGLLVATVERIPFTKKYRLVPGGRVQVVRRDEEGQTSVILGPIDLRPGFVFLVDDEEFEWL
jgi:PKD repeat protein